MTFNEGEKRYGYYQKYAPQIGYTLLKPGNLSIYISPEAAKELVYSGLIREELAMAKEVTIKELLERACKLFSRACSVCAGANRQRFGIKRKSNAIRGGIDDERG